nr:MAG TPA: hypothetical protein [Caudoviricetes sp.]DAH93870.1 MAG TPA: hypothetical protein [Caudoviricetes sp.]
MESLRFMMGGQLKEPTTTAKVAVHLTEEGTVKTADTAPELKHHLTGTTLTLPAEYRYMNLTTGTRGTVGGDGEEAGTFKAAVGDRVRFFWTEEVDGQDEAKSAVEITISPNTFPGASGSRLWGFMLGNKIKAKQSRELLGAVIAYAR